MAPGLVRKGTGSSHRSSGDSSHPSGAPSEGRSATPRSGQCGRSDGCLTSPAACSRRTQPLGPLSSPDRLSAVTRCHPVTSIRGVSIEGNGDTSGIARRVHHGVLLEIAPAHLENLTAEAVLVDAYTLGYPSQARVLFDRTGTTRRLVTIAAGDLRTSLPLPSEIRQR